MRVNRGSLWIASLLAVAACGASAENGGPSDAATPSPSDAPSAPGPSMDAGILSSPDVLSPAEGDAPSGAPGDGASGFGTGTDVPDAALLGDAGASRTFTIVNSCAQTVWAAALPNSTFPGGPIELAPGDSFRVGVDNGWSGRIWGKVQCATATGKLTCAGDTFPSSLAELTLTMSAMGLDFYDVSLVDGFNLPIAIEATGHTADPAHPYDCGSPTCAANLNATCPQPLQDSVDGGILACANDECKVLGDNDASNPDCIYPNSYTEYFKSACPTSYSYPSDDPTSTFTCKGINDYAVVFCP
jgi:hypothetical protein